MQAIKARELTKQYKNLTAVDKLTLDIQQGELFSLLGVNGAGKTTAIKMLSCLTIPTAGDAEVGGYSVTKEPEQVKRLIGVSPQETAVAPNLSVKENLELICGIHGFSKEKTKAKIRELAAAGQHCHGADQRAPNPVSGRTLPGPGCDCTAQLVGCDPFPERKNHHHPDNPLHGRSGRTF